MSAEGNPLQLLWRVVKEAKIGRAIGTRAKARTIPQRVGISQRTTGRVLTFVPLEERVDILPQPNDGGLAHRIIRLATEILFNALHDFNG